MSENPDQNAHMQTTNSLPEPLATCITTAQARCAALRLASQAYHALELLLTAAQRAKAPELLTHKSEVAALLTLVREESARRLDEALESTEDVAALCEARRAPDGS